MGSDRHAERFKLIGLWLQRAPHKRTENDVLEFYLWLRKEHPTLLEHLPDDPYESLWTDLSLYLQKVA